jgi:hypothetical protein
MSYRDRPHASLKSVELHGGITYLQPAQSLKEKYTGPGSKRYAAAIRISNSIFVSIYEINSRSVFLQYAPNPIIPLQEPTSFIKGLRGKPNLEARIIGMQNNDDSDGLVEILDTIGSLKVPLVEVDLFGNEIRHIALDLALGQTYNLLLENRIYHPGELINKAPNTAIKGPAAGLSEPIAVRINKDLYK